jgi:penicillin-binding protein 2
MNAVVNSINRCLDSQKVDRAGVAVRRQKRHRPSVSPSERELGITQAQLPWHLRHHALFVCFGPVDNPRYACAVIVEHGMAGGTTAGPIGRDVLLETMKRDPSRRTDKFRKMASR